MKFKIKFLIGVLLSSLSVLATGQPINFTCCVNNDNTPAFWQIDSCNEINQKPSDDCKAQFCDANNSNCTGVEKAASATVNPYVSSKK